MFSSSNFNKAWCHLVRDSWESVSLRLLIILNTTSKLEECQARAEPALPRIKDWLTLTTMYLHFTTNTTINIVCMSENVKKNWLANTMTEKFYFFLFLLFFLLYIFMCFCFQKKNIKPTKDRCKSLPRDFFKKLATYPGGGVYNFPFGYGEWQGQVTLFFFRFFFFFFFTIAILRNKILKKQLCFVFFWKKWDPFYSLIFA